jgi:hypothetical protein
LQGVCKAVYRWKIKIIKKKNVFQDMIHRMGLFFWQLWYMMNSAGHLDHPRGGFLIVRSGSAALRIVGWYLLSPRRRNSLWYWRLFHPSNLPL